MRRTRMMLATAVVALSLSAASGTGAALAQAHDDDHGSDDPTDLAEQCRSYNIIEWLLFHHECHGHTTGTPYWPASWM
jgi:hypothetical protein